MTLLSGCVKLARLALVSGACSCPYDGGSAVYNCLQTALLCASHDFKQRICWCKKEATHRFTLHTACRGSTRSDQESLYLCVAYSPGPGCDNISARLEDRHLTI